MKLIVNIPQTTLRLLGLAVLKKNKRNILEGKDKKGKSFKPYSTNPFGMPAGAATKRAISTLDKKDGLIWFTTKEGSKWIIVKDGYKEYKKAKKPSHSGVVNLSDSGQMINDYQVINVKTNEVWLGFGSKKQAEKALWNIEMGRDFIGIPDDELEKIAEDLIGEKIEVEVVE